MNISVVWHKNPDTDCTLSAIIMADYLTKKWYNAIPYIQGTLNKETLYLLEKYSITTPSIQNTLSSEAEVCLVDHNETSQAPDNLSELNITWLVDHHKIKFESNTPLNIRIEPLCSTASILYKMYRESHYDISQSIATMMLACIMSDSLLWKSPTTTDEDKVIAWELQKIAHIDSLDDFATAMFEAKSDLWDMPVKELIQYDYKIFEFQNIKIWVWTLETTNPWYGLWRKDEILEWMKELKAGQNLDFIMLSIVDILWEANTTITLNEDNHIIESVFQVSVIENLSNLWARLSRKKQIIPNLTEYFNKK